MGCGLICISARCGPSNLSTILHAFSSFCLLSVRKDPVAVRQVQGMAEPPERKNLDSEGLGEESLLLPTVSRTGYG